MKIIDSTTYFEEDLMMDVRFNVLDPYVDEFIVCEASFSHSGKEKKIHFDKKKFPKFEKKINHIILEKEPDDLIKKNDLSFVEKRSNSIARIRDQRNYISKFLSKYEPEDYIIHSDNDEIPDLKNFDLKKNQKKIVIFNQKIFYYKLNLSLTDLSWFGSKACKLKNLKSIDYLRSIKNRQYSFFRFDTLFSDNKHNSVEIVNNGGWHFSNLKTIESLENKYLNDENHAEYEIQNTSIEKIKDNVKRQVVPYNYKAKKNSVSRFNETKLTKVDIEELPKYLKKNIIKYKKWIIN